MAPSDDENPSVFAAGEAQEKPLSPAAQRALAEAAERRAAAERTAAERTPEIGGRSGPEPTRYGVWEICGIASDF